MRIISAKEIRETMSLDDFLDSIEQCYHIYHSENYDQPDRFVHNSDKNSIMYMPCLVPNTGFGTKFITVFPDNWGTNAPVVDGIMVVNDPKTGEFVGLIDGRTLTGFRTGAIGGYAVKKLAHEDAHSLCVIGAGVQAYYNTLFACHVKPITDVYISSLYQQEIIDLIEKLKPSLEHINFHACESAEEGIANSQIIITTTTSPKPVVPKNCELYKGKTIVAIGSYKPNMRELCDECIGTANRVYYDCLHTCDESGDICIPVNENVLSKDKLFPMSDAVVHDFSRTSDETIVFKTAGMALFDVIVAQRIYEKSCNDDSGVVVDLFN
eukprot:TRINITY_DN1422_c0_g1_i1.p1 TRINITY_DN1422_c0_g1~~TRINITY_DN1422_c0_g1_i1.p1  ORF type:complete len:324 (+),score=84.91 TRINITY_DN1422_c0_g1_i1:30-1001(+)